MAADLRMMSHTSRSAITPPMRDLLIALPERDRADVYIEHQAVWRELVRQGVEAANGAIAPFLFASDGRGLIEARVAHATLRAPLARPQHAGWFRCRVLAETRLGGTGRPVAMSALPDFVRSLMARHGLQVSHIQVDDVQQRVGIKRECAAIRLHSAEVLLKGSFEDPGRAHIAWHQGIGRAKRFGCGMLRAA